MEIGYMVVLSGILSLGLALYLAHLIISSILESCKDREKLDWYVLAFTLPLIVSAILSYKAFDFAYYYCIEFPKQREVETREREAYRDYLNENGKYEYKESELVVIDKNKKHRSLYRGLSDIEYIVLLEDASGNKYKKKSRSLYFDVEIGDTVIRELTIVTDKSNGDFLESRGPYYYKKESCVIKNT